jgi:hypothetical protein
MKEEFNQLLKQIANDEYREDLLAIHSTDTECLEIKWIPVFNDESLFLLI